RICQARVCRRGSALRCERAVLYGELRFCDGTRVTSPLPSHHALCLGHAGCVMTCQPSPAQGGGEGASIHERRAERLGSASSSANSWVEYVLSQCFRYTSPGIASSDTGQRAITCALRAAPRMTPVMPSGIHGLAVKGW